VIPIENSQAGSVRESIDLLIEQNLKIFGEIEIRVVHNLIGHKGTAPSDIKTIISHPQALSQCSNWILKNHPNVNTEESSSTAKAIKDIAEMKLKPGEYAAIGTEIAAKLNNLDVFYKGIENNTQNYTRFLIISKNENIPTDRDKTSIVFVTKHVPGALYGVLKLFADAEINLLKIESRPRKNVRFEYVFICDFEGNVRDKKIKKTLEEIQNYTIWLKVLGSYPMSTSSS
jgi:prephenate dehydratase